MVYVRDFLKRQYRISKEGLHLYGNEYTLNDLGKHPSFIATRQKGWQGKWQITICDSDEQGECGLSLYADCEHHMYFVIEYRGAKRYIYVRKCVGDIKHKGKEIEVLSMPTKLSITSDDTQYVFCYTDENGNEYVIDSTLCKHLATEVVNFMFTGVMCGMYVYGKEKQAIFKNLKYDFALYD